MLSEVPASDGKDGSREGPQQSGETKEGKEIMKAFLCQGLPVVSRVQAATALGMPLRKIDILGIDCASQPEPWEGRLRYILEGGEKYFVLADIEALEEWERALRASGPNDNSTKR